MKLRKWGVLFLVLAVVVMLLAGCAEPAAEEEPANGEEPAENGEEPAEGAYVDGTYVGVGQGFGGDIELEVTVSGGEIAGIEVVSHSETEDIGGAAFDELIDSAIAAQGADIDVKSGATMTSEGFIAALEDALSQAQ